MLDLTGLIILVGLASELVFARTGIPSVLCLVGFGVLLSPVFHFAEPAMVMTPAPYFGTRALLALSLNADYYFCGRILSFGWSDSCLNHEHCTTKGRIVNFLPSLAHS